MNYHTLSDFRVGHVEELDKLLTESVAALTYTGVVDLKRVAQDGVRVRASGGAASFRRKATLEKCLDEAREQVTKLKKEHEDDPAASTRRKQAAKQRALRERQQRVEEALRQLPQVAAKKRKRNRDKNKPAQEREARVSSTDPDARVMKMPDGGFRPAYNFQFATATDGQVIAGVDVINCGSDQGRMGPMVQQLTGRYGKAPEEILIDGGFATKPDIENVAQAPFECTVYAPVQKPKDANRSPYLPQPGDSSPVGAWRIRMGTEEAKAIYKDRAATAECVNAIARNRGLQRLLVRGLRKVKAIALWFALAHNMMRTVTLLGDLQAAS